MSIKVLGSGCKFCHELYENTKEAVKNIGLSVEVEYVTDLEQVMGYGGMSMRDWLWMKRLLRRGRCLRRPMWRNCCINWGTDDRGGDFCYEQTQSSLYRQTL